MKILNKIKSIFKYLFIILLFLSQILIFFSIGSLADYLKSINVFWADIIYEIYVSIVFLLTIIIFFKVLYSREDPEFKLPWLLLIALIPLMGIIIYIIFKQKDLTKKQKKLLVDIKKAYSPYFDSKLHKEKENDNYNEPINFLENIAEFNACKNNELKYYDCGEKFFPELIDYLKKAKQFIFLEFFIIHEGKLWDEILPILKQKAKEGVEVRLLYDDVGCFSTLPTNYASKLRKEGIFAYRFNPVHLIVSGTYNNRSHRKIVIIDHEIAFTGGMNIGDEYANKIERFGYWKDTMISIKGNGINNLIALFLTDYDLTVKKVSDYDKYLNYQYPIYESKSLIYPFGTGPANIYPVRVGEQNYVNLIECAMHKLYISTPYLIPSTDIMNSLQRAALRGVDVRLFVPFIPDKKLVYKVTKFNIVPLIKSGVKVYYYTPGFNHMKTLLADDMAAFIGTINLDFRSLVHHYEDGVTIVDGEIMQDIKNDFEKMECQSILIPKDFKLRKRDRFICLLVRLIMPLL